MMVSLGRLFSFSFVISCFSMNSLYHTFALKAAYLLDFLRFLITYLTVKVRMKTASNKGLVLMVKSIFSVQWKALP